VFPQLPKLRGSSLSSPVPPEDGGTGATTLAGARSALSVYSQDEIDAALADYLPLTGGTVTGSVEVRNDSGSPQFVCSYSTTKYMSAYCDSGGKAEFRTVGDRFLFKNNIFGTDGIEFDLLSLSTPVFKVGGATMADYIIFNSDSTDGFALGDSSLNKLVQVNDTGIGLFGATPVAQREILAPLTDSTGGTPATTIAAVSGTGDDSGINNALASLVARITSIESELVASTFMAQAS